MYILLALSGVHSVDTECGASCWHSAVYMEVLALSGLHSVCTQQSTPSVGCEVVVARWEYLMPSVHEAQFAGPWSYRSVPTEEADGGLDAAAAVANSSVLVFKLGRFEEMFDRMFDEMFRGVVDRTFEEMFRGQGMFDGMFAFCGMLDKAFDELCFWIF